MWLYSRAGHMDLHYELFHVAGLQGKKKVFIAFLKYYFAQKKTEQSENLKRQSYCTYWMTLKLYANSWII